MKKTNIKKDFIIGFLAGIIVFSVALIPCAFLTLIPLFLIYKLVNSPNQNDELKELIKERDLK